MIRNQYYQKVNGHVNGKLPNSITNNGGITAKNHVNGHVNKFEDKHSTISLLKCSKLPYHEIKKKLRDNSLLFEDNDFSPSSKALFNHKKPVLQPIVWLRPHEICNRPQFQEDGTAVNKVSFSVETGELGDQCLLSAIASLTLTPHFLERVVPSDQGFDNSHHYCGVFRFRFWHFGEWKDIVIDDRLPTYRGRLVYIRCTNSNEFWASLLEKAYAKFYGCYENFSMGSISRALQDLTGGIVQNFMLSHQERFLTYQILNSAVPRSSLLIATITSDKDSKRNLRLRNGLITQHSYSVTGLARVRGTTGDVPLIRLKNPYGFGEWTGAWSERSWEWDGLSSRDKELLSERIKNEGEFWMCFDDFSKYFTQLDVVHIGPDDWMLESSLHSKKPWRAVLARRRWRAGYNAGGGPQFTDLTSLNPQFHVQIPRNANTKCHVVVSVTQYYEMKISDSRNKIALYAIGFSIYEVPHSISRLTPTFIAEKKPLDVTNHSMSREVVTFFTLPPGDYIILPQTNLPHFDGKFILRIFTDEPSYIWEVNDDNTIQNLSNEFIKTISRSNSDLAKVLTKYPREIDAKMLQKILKNVRKPLIGQKISYELCKSLIMLRDSHISGKINVSVVPLVIHLVQYWRVAFQKFDKCYGCNKTSSYNLRYLLWEVGVTVSNKVLECLVVRFTKNRILNLENFIMAMVRLYLAHECGICLQECTLPTRLQCGHVFCFLCVKGIRNRMCAICRQSIAAEDVWSPSLLINLTADRSDDAGTMKWFYEGTDGWWQYDDRTNDELENAYQLKMKTHKIMVAGFLYNCDFEQMLQTRCQNPLISRRIKRDSATADKKGIAGIKL